MVLFPRVVLKSIVWKQLKVARKFPLAQHFALCPIFSLSHTGTDEMAANFWNSTHYRNWLRNADDLIRESQAVIKRWVFHNVQLEYKAQDGMRRLTLLSFL